MRVPYGFAVFVLALTSPSPHPYHVSQWAHPRNRVENLDCSCGIAQLSGRRFDPVAEESQFSDHLRGAALPGVSTHRRAPFLVVNSLVQDQPDKSTKPMANCADGLMVSQARQQAAVYDFEDASFVLDGSVGRLIENPPHMAVAFR